MEIRHDQGTVETAIGSHIYSADCKEANAIYMEWDSLAQSDQEQLQELQGNLEVHAEILNQFILSLHQASSVQAK